MRIVAISDTHEQEENVWVPECDILIHAGDFTYTGKFEKIAKFNNWCEKLLKDGSVKKKIIVIAGNHDLTFDGWDRRNGFVRYIQLKEKAESLLTSCEYLNQTSLIIDGITFYGEPRQPLFYNWAFNIPRPEMKTKCWDLVPKNIDVLITHGPPNRAGDKTLEGEEVGCVALRHWIKENQPKLVICGHIHEANGVYKIKNTTVVNASSLGRDYKTINPAYIIDVDDETKNVTWIKKSY